MTGVVAVAQCLLIENKIGALVKYDLAAEEVARYDS